MVKPTRYRNSLHVFTIIFYYLHVSLIYIHVSFDILFFCYRFEMRVNTVTTVDTVTQPDAGRQMAMTARRAVGRLAKAAFARLLEWENQPAGRRLVARPAGTSRTIVAARGTFHQRAPSSFLLPAFSNTYLDPYARGKSARKNLSRFGRIHRDDAVRARSPGSEGPLDDRARILIESSPRGARVRGVKVLRG